MIKIFYINLYHRAISPALIQTLDINANHMKKNKALIT